MTRRLLLTVLGAIVGGAALSSVGILVGAVMGFGSALFLEMREEVEDLTLRMSLLELRASKTAAARRSAAAAAAKAEAHIERDTSERLPEETSAEEIAQKGVPRSEPDPVVEPVAPQRPAPQRVRVPRTESTEESVVAPAAKRMRPAPTVQEEPDEPSLAEQAWALLTGGNPLARIGIAMLFVGLVFLVSYVSERGYLSIELRLAATAAAGLGLVIGGWLLRRRAAVYAVTLQGGGVAVMYLTVFGAFQLYDVIAPTPAFALLVAIAAFSAVLAIVQNAPVLAVAGTLGGFGAPILASTGQGDHVLLFSYYAVLNAGVFAVAYFKAWRSLYLVGFVCTFVIGGVWGGLQYEPTLFATTEPFLILFFALYFAIPLFTLHRHAPRIGAPIDGSLVFGLPVAAFALQAVLVDPFAFGRAWSALALALVYLGAAMGLFRRRRPEARPLVEAFFAIGLTFATLTIPFALDGVWSGALWLLEGAALVWTGLRQRRLGLRLAGIGLQLVALFMLASAAEAWNVPASVWLSGLLGALTLGASAYGLHASAHVRDWERRLSPLLLVFGLILWNANAIMLLTESTPGAYIAYVPTALLVFAAASAWAFAEGGHRLSWPRLGALALPQVLVAAYLLLPMMLFVGDHPSADGGWLAWPLAFLGLGAVLRRREGASPTKRLGFAHAASLWLLALVATCEVAWALDRWGGLGEGWPEAGVGVVLALLVLAVLRPPAPLDRWIQPNRSAYLHTGAGGLAIALFGWSILTNLYSSGDPAPLSYIPLLNPFDLAQVAALLVLAIYARALTRSEDSEDSETAAVALAKALSYPILSAAVFIAISGLVARTVHHLAGIAFDPDVLFGSTLFQTALSITWALLAMVLMITATKRRLRTPWLIGAALLALVGIKLIAVDLSNAATLARIVSFVGVGLLVLLIGYFSPAPPRRDEPTAAEPKTVS